MDHSSQVSSRDAKQARALARDFSDLWHARLARHVDDLLPASLSDLTLELGCYAGALTRRLAPRLGTSGKLIAIEPDPAMAWIAAQDLETCPQREQIIIRQASLEEAFELGRRSCDNIVSNLTFGDRIADWSSTAKQLRPMLRPGGRFVASLILRDSWREAEDLLAETFRQMNLREALLGLQRLQQLRPSLSGIHARMEDTLSLRPNEFVVKSHRMELLFSTARHFLATPLVVHGPLRFWRTILRKFPVRTQQECLWRFRTNVDTYYRSRPFRCSVRAAVIAFEGVGVRPKASGPALVESYQSRFPSLLSAADNTQDFDLDEFEIELEDHDAGISHEQDVTATSSEPTYTDIHLSAHPTTATNPIISASDDSDDTFLGGPIPESLRSPHAQDQRLPTVEESSEDMLGEFSLEFDDDD
ncbi:MAG: class I SAM-dependent methyltransferase [Nannocystaceae bacterium]